VHLRLQIAFSWIQLGFVGLLEVDQLLLLWDRVIGTFWLPSYLSLLVCCSAV
jgi:hypothetical protein